MADTDSTLEIEEWRDIPNWGGYQASSLGRIRSIARIVEQQRKRKICRMPYPSRVLRPAIQKVGTGYYAVALSCPRRGPKTWMVHRLVCLAFHGPVPFEHAVVLHLDDDSRNNRPENLRWGTQKENMATVKNGNAKLNEGQLRELYMLREAGMPFDKIAKLLGVAKSTVRYRWTQRKQKDLRGWENKSQPRAKA